ncbi:MAG: DUF4410 domain-containing protein [Nitrospira sp.]
MTSGVQMHQVKVLFFVFVGLSVSACAHSPGSYEPVIPLKTGTTIERFTNLHLEATNKNEVPMVQTDRERLVNNILRQLQVTNRFKELNVANPSPNTLNAMVEVTNYDKGNAFLRFLLAGLGQIHIDGTLTLQDRDRSDVLGTYEVNKTFAWGGLYGMGTKIEEVEEGFAAAIAEILLGKDKKAAAEVEIAEGSKHSK